ncbi:hypothetical protein KSP40_PGU001911 [Platanthera guangdongensis]|uniref:FLZ-type domain-containing protein n=1 Tax=Platanthera guangdongensis TaxID=2320717 RepID=A0ABR2M9M9_9ASPA
MACSIHSRHSSPFPQDLFQGRDFATSDESGGGLISEDSLLLNRLPSKMCATWPRVLEGDLSYFHSYASLRQRLLVDPYNEGWKKIFRSSHEQSSVAKSRILIDRSYLCRKELNHQKEVYMYRLETPFTFPLTLFCVFLKEFGGQRTSSPQVGLNQVLCARHGME